MAKHKTTIRIGAAHWDINVGSYLHEDIARPDARTGEWLHPRQMRERLTTLAAFICHTHGITNHAHASRITHPPRVHKRPKRSPTPGCPLRAAIAATIVTGIVL